MLVLLAFMTVSAGGAIAQAGHDGDWWRSLPEGTKHSVMTGFLDGMALGHNISLMGAGNSPDPGCRPTIEQSYTYARNKFFRNVAPPDIVSALDELYAEGDNRSIIIGRAVWIAVNRLGGASQDDLQKLILQSRGLRY
jgi:hypothetical protein